ncbi:MAG: restriction endonuclease subunit S, partial [Gemmatimonadetes bacterium]|nr:restriction endonuclease subunit S [Gemmatimonadota bacterium]
MTAKWRDTTLGDIAEIVSGATPKTSVEQYWGGGVPWVTPTDLSGLGGMYIDSTARTLTTAGLKSCASSILPAHSVLLSSRAPIGLVAINTVPMATNQGFKSLVPDHSQVDSKFLYWWLRRYRVQLEARGNGATFKEVSKRVVSSVPISLPPIEEQRRIAVVLDTAEELRAKRRQALAKLDSLMQSIFIDMLGYSGQDTWRTSPVAELAAHERGSIRTGPFGSQLLHEEFLDDGPVAVLGIDNAVKNRFLWGERRFITNEKYEDLKRYTVRSGDVLVTIMGTCGM